ncbi:MAG: polyribonucleotide nucleotidyltransferase [Candidatus Marinimicrobia bacterium]|nr:polyribonucleotide nucleotidyltransferase [Candidatus Neomarinimicrobiota bacterium]
MSLIKHSMDLAGRTLTIESGEIAKQSAGSVIVRYGDTVVLSAVNATSEPREGIDFFPLTVDYRERAYAGGKIPGGYFKREGRPSEKEILASRLTDRPIRPLFPEEFRCETQVLISLLSTDNENPGDVLGTIGTSVAIMLSDIPWNGPIASVKLGFIGGRPVLNPTNTELEDSKLDLVISGTEKSIIMIEGEANELSEDDLLTTIEYGHEAIKDIVKFQKEFLENFSIRKRKLDTVEISPELIREVEKRADGNIRPLNQIPDKISRKKSVSDFVDKIWSELEEDFPEDKSTISKLISEKIKIDVRRMITEESKRIDGRALDEIRPISVSIGILPRTHGSALFTRGETQGLATVTLGTKSDEQYVDDIEGEFKKKFMLHYNFPPYSVGEIKRYLGISRREVGHGNLAERALKIVMPTFEKFPYTVRVVTDILESNGSSSMASVCAGSLALMDSGVPISNPVAGVSVGLVKEGEKEVLLTDILGEEDHSGDMDFKVAGTRGGITSVQVDLKIEGMPIDLIAKALKIAKEGRLHILDIMESCIKEPKETLSPYAPKIVHIKIEKNKIGEVIGPGGRNIRNIISESSAEVEIDDDGTIVISSESYENCKKAKEMVEALIIEPEVGMIFEGQVKRIMDFGAFIQLAPGKEGLLHISEIEHRRIDKVDDVIKEGEIVKVKIIKVDFGGKFGLSRKALIERPHYSSNEGDNRNRK